ncbi:uncharacterized protein K489DRAFT_247804 [Dissoconium aciculare CBS 342.82]|uniref:Uncharacterized protein n=1 Tax=Dissoconium aciculare CBS 342.82 TaxID=1314786 RepID=A0A6J3M1P3_9PEZI|nr:uncharacterized protein K489DRAFT_247804 [Dissoconium aciculare CBS 342.82]KAF1821424.1 hypothetical protein K489DRAFT_247804 [Dissoconium aciculare CBS 342.82]
MTSTTILIPSRKKELFLYAFLTGLIRISLVGHYFSALGLHHLYVLGLSMLAQQILCMTSVNDALFSGRRPSSTCVPPRQVSVNVTRKDSDVSIRISKPPQCEQRVDAEEAAWAILQRKDSAIDGIDLPPPPKTNAAPVQALPPTRHVTWSTASSVSSGSFIDPFEGSSHSKLPADYKQAFIVKRDRFFLHRAECSPSSLQEDLTNVEARIQSILFRHRRPTITIRRDLAYSNFPLLCDMTRRAVNSRGLCLAGCETLYIDIDLTSTAPSFDVIRNVRLNVDNFTRMLAASSKSSPLPKLHISFSTSSPSTIRASHFAVAMGPFYRLSNIEHVNIEANQAMNPLTGSYEPIFARKSNRRNGVRAARICAAIKQCMTSQHPANAELISQQLIFDVKMELLHIESNALLDSLDLDSDEELLFGSQKGDGQASSGDDSDGTSSGEGGQFHQKRPVILTTTAKPQSPRDRLYSRMTCFDTMPASIARRIDLALADLHDLHLPFTNPRPQSPSASSSTQSRIRHYPRHQLQKPLSPPPRWLQPLQTAMRLERPSYAILTLMAVELFPGASFANARAWIAGVQPAPLLHGERNCSPPKLGEGCGLAWKEVISGL